MRSSIQSTKPLETVSNSSIRHKLISSKEKPKDKRNRFRYSKVLMENLRQIKVLKKAYLLQKKEIFKEVRIWRC